MIPWTGSSLSSQSLVYWKVRTWDENDTPSKWSHIARFSVGLLEKKDWQAEYIGLSTEDGNPDFPQLRKNFNFENPGEETLLHVNSLGYHEVYINNQKVDDSVLTPAVSEMDKRTFTITYDVSPFLREGQNTIAFWLGEGWFHDGLPGVDYAGPLVKAQLETLVSGAWTVTLATGKGWKARPSEITRIGTWHSGRYGGERVDARRIIDQFSSPELDDSSWTDAAVVEIPERLVIPQTAELNRIRETIQPAEIREFEGKDTWLVDFGKNLTGWVEIDFKGLKTGQEITMEFADFFLEDGSLKIHNQQDIYIAGPGERQSFRNRFNYHGFRYLKIKNLKAKPAMDSIRAYLIHTDYKIASSFESSDRDLNKIHDMILYTLRCLSLGGYLVDCPQIERLGYGGDGNASTPTAQTMFNLGPLYSNWLDHWRDCIRPDGSMPHTAPNPYSAGGGPYWCGFIITASWNTWQNYGDMEVLKKNYSAMKQWLEYVNKYSPEGLLKPWPETEYRSWYLGDWASPEGVDDK
ncbi:MAG: family 78 glycoside hydrolase catalytic domain, partial [Anaerolineales bacterium]|nr:family 78 glycoside hydrolase catalytic domain [Anaerolineales bacterium]